MSLLQAYTGARIVETNDNYARADGPLKTAREVEPSSGTLYFYEDGDFWVRILQQSGQLWNSTVVTKGPVVMSEWVARVPGLFWTPESLRLRQLTPAAVESKSNGWSTFTPWGKSQLVMGGIGTFRLAPGADGTQLVTLSSSHNATAGVPALISPDVGQKIRRRGRCEGRALYARGRWMPMAEGWADRFKSTRALPRGYLVVDDGDAVEVLDMQGPVQIHPFTVMDYHSGSKELFDYVYATADTGEPAYRSYLARFFDSYKKAKERDGRYLLPGDSVDPLWDAEFSSPADLRRTDPTAQSHLGLLEARVREHMLGDDTVERLLERIAATATSPEDIQRIAKDASIPPARWFRGGTLAQIASQLVAEAVSLNKLDALVEAFAFDHSEAILA